MAETHRFTAELEAARAGGASLLVPGEIASALGGLKQMRVVGTVNGVPETRAARLEKALSQLRALPRPAR